MEKNNFEASGLSDGLEQSIADIGFENFTDIQIKAIPLILEGKDIIAQSQTGSGKTAAFALPILDLIDVNCNPQKTQALVLCPTRELAAQTCGEFEKFAKYKVGINIVPLFGGCKIDRQMYLIKQGCQIVVGTPGRILDHIRRKKLDLSALRFAVLDEADEMLDMGFKEDIELILQISPDTRQTLLFSATLPKPITEIASKFQKQPVWVKSSSAGVLVSGLRQFFVNASGSKSGCLARLIECEEPQRAMVFCNTKAAVKKLSAELCDLGLSAQGLHGDMEQPARTQIMDGFKAGKFNILVSTDVAARGIDVSDIEIVFNYDLPLESALYVHRLGRTARAGKQGRAISIIASDKDLFRLKKIMQYTKSDIEKYKMPSESKLLGIKAGRIAEEARAFLKGRDMDEYMRLAEKYLGAEDQAAISAAFLGMLIEKQRPDLTKLSPEDEILSPLDIDRRNGVRKKKTASGRQSGAKRNRR